MAVDGGGQIRYLNPAAERLTGWPRAEATLDAVRPIGVDPGQRCYFAAPVLE